MGPFTGVILEDHIARVLRVLTHTTPVSPLPVHGDRNKLDTVNSSTITYWDWDTNTICVSVLQWVVLRFYFFSLHTHSLPSPPFYCSLYTLPSRTEPTSSFYTKEVIFLSKRYFSVFTIEPLEQTTWVNYPTTPEDSRFSSSRENPGSSLPQLSGRDRKIGVP